MSDGSAGMNLLAQGTEPERSTPGSSCRRTRSEPFRRANSELPAQAGMSGFEATKPRNERPFRAVPPKAAQ